MQHVNSLMSFVMDYTIEDLCYYTLLQKVCTHVVLKSSSI